jgi:pimeloyl-ACP methyl ester carboxylesterase
MDWWEDEFCARLAAGGRFVIRYDHRDTGRSVTDEPGAPRYTMGDLVADVVGLLDALELPAAHLVGMSMGGAIVQLVALDRPERVASLTLISTSLVGRDGPELPGMSEETIAAFRALPEPDWRDRDAVTDHLVALARISAARSRPFDEARFRALAGRVVDRSANIASSIKNHNILVAGDPPPVRRERLDTPTLVVHGTEDPVLPFEHGLALAGAVAGARLLRLEHTGHELPAPVWDAVVPAILEHTSVDGR